MNLGKIGETCARCGGAKHEGSCAWWLQSTLALSFWDRLRLLFGACLRVRFWSPDGNCHAACSLSAEVQNSSVSFFLPWPVERTGVSLIALERKRQMAVEGWTIEHDDTHVNGELALAAARYAINDTRVSMFAARALEALWPWDRRWWKPKGPIDNLTRAGALIAAEIDRHLRIEEKERSQS